MGPHASGRSSPRTMRRGGIAVPLLVSVGGLVLAGTIHGHGSTLESSAGVVVDQVAKASPAEKAGLRAGDVIESWSRPPVPPANPEAAQAPVETPFDLSRLELDQLPRGAITLAGRRGTAGMTWTLTPVLSVGLGLRPVLTDALLARYEEGKALVASDDPEAGAARWREAAADARKEGHLRPATWLLAKAAAALAEARIWPGADAAYADAIGEGPESASPAVRAHLLREWAGTFLARNEWDPAEDRYRRALALEEALDPNSLGVAQGIQNLGVVAWSRRDLARAGEHWRQALALREKSAPGSLPTAQTLNNLGAIPWTLGDLASAEDYFGRALAIREKLDPGGTDVAESLNNLGILARNRGDYITAEEHYRRALAIREALAPGSLVVAQSLHNLGTVATERRDLVRAGEYLRASLAIKEKLGPGGLPVALTVEGLGLIAYLQGDLAAAEDHYRRALAIREKLSPASFELTPVLNNLGGIAQERGDLAKAEEYFRHALRLREQIAPGSLRFAEILVSLADLMRVRSDEAAAETYLRRALAIKEKLVPGTATEADTLHDLGRLYRRTGRNEDAAGFLLRALDAIEGQKRKLGGTDQVRSAFGAGYAAYYHDAVEALVDLGRPAEALHVLERGRARLLLAMLAERDLLFGADLEPELARERRQADTEYDRVQAAVSRLSPGEDDKEIDTLLGRQRELRERQEEIVARIRRASPRFASLQYPQPLELAGVREALDPGTLLLAYSVGAERTVLLLVEPAGVPGTGVSALSLPIGEKGLREKVEAFRRAVQRPVEAERPALNAQAGDLYDLLVRPAEAAITRADRLLVSPDGPLQSLPFAALRRNVPGAAPSYLTEGKAVHLATSATVYAQLKKSRRREGSSSLRLVAFGDPRYPRPASVKPRLGNAEVRSVTRDFTLAPLPRTRDEVRTIAGLFPQAARAYLGEEATEEHAKAVGKDARYVHFACHGFLDERFPLNSGLALTIPEPPAEGRDNGLLQAWEIFDKVRLDADLVTLSACKTGLGKEMGGEGLLGLTRAFHYAGARSVLATLWAVSDRSTPELMKRFYGYVKAGKSRDEALRAAQIDLIRARSSSRGSADLSHPFRWAAFQLSGDWR